MPRRLCSKINEDSTLELSIENFDTPPLEPDDVLIRIEAAPVNPSDLGLLLGPADVSTARELGKLSEKKIIADIDTKLMPSAAPRLGRLLPTGNEGAGTIVEAGASPESQSSVGKIVATWGGRMYADYKVQKHSECLVLNTGTSADQGASCFVNPLTVLGMIGTMRLENHTAIVHTAAASNLGQMLVKACKNEDVPLVNIVRSPEHVSLLERLGAKYICNSSAATFFDDLVSAISETGATLAFDAIGGGQVGSKILQAMEISAASSGKTQGPYGSMEHKQLYIYGGLEQSPTILNRAFGMAWGMGGWLLPYYLNRVGMEESERMRQQVADEIKTTFSSEYTRRVGLDDMLTIEAVQTVRRQATGEKYLITPQE